MKSLLLYTFIALIQLPGTLWALDDQLVSQNTSKILSIEAQLAQLTRRFSEYRLYHEREIKERVEAAKWEMLKQLDQMFNEKLTPLIQKQIELQLDKKYSELYQMVYSLRDDVRDLYLRKTPQQ